MLYFVDRALQTEVKDGTGVDVHCVKTPKPESECKKSAAFPYPIIGCMLRADKANALCLRGRGSMHACTG